MKDQHANFVLYAIFKNKDMMSHCNLSLNDNEEGGRDYDEDYVDYMLKGRR